MNKFSKFYWPMVFLAIVGLLIGGTFLPQRPAFAASVTPTVIPGANNDGKLCENVAPGSTEVRVVSDGNGYVPLGTTTVGSYSVTITKSTTNPYSVDFTASGGTVVAAVVKDGVDGANLYDYGSNGTVADTDLRTPNSGSKGISHINFCFMPSTVTDTPTNTPVVPTATSTATNTVVPPTCTPVPTNTAVAPTNTPTDTPTNTAVAPTNTPTDTPTNTAVAPTNTPTDTPTNTAVAPTNTPMDTPTDTPTNTGVPTIPTLPPTATPTPKTTGEPSATPTKTPIGTPVPTGTPPTALVCYDKNGRAVACSEPGAVPQNPVYLPLVTK